MPSLRVALAAVLVALVSACAAGPTRVELRDPFPAAATATATAVPVTLLAVRDLRPEPARIGVKRSTSGDAVGEVVLANERPLADLLAEHLTAAFAAQGIALRAGAAEEGTPSVAVDILRFWAELRPGAWQRDVVGEIELRLEVTRDGRPLQMHTFEGKAVASSPGGGAFRLYDLALNGAYADVLRALETELASGSLGAHLRSAR